MTKTLDESMDATRKEGQGPRPLTPTGRVLRGKNTYVLSEPLEPGAKVYFAQCQDNGREVFVKAYALGEKARFIRELAVQKVLGQGHQNILSLLDHGEDEKQYFAVFPKASNGDLKNLLTRKKSLSLKEMQAIISPVCDALNYMHGLNIVHRDIKPSNILFDQDCSGLVTLVSDFDVSLHETVAHLETQGAVHGTLKYLPPEVWLGDIADHRADIYALGVTAYEILTGNQPFAGRDLVEIMHKHLTQETPSIREDKPELPGELSWVLQKAMYKDPELRYQSAQEFKKDLEKALEKI